MAVQIEKIHLRDAANNGVALPSGTYTNNGTTASVSELFTNNKKVTQAVTAANGDYPVILKATTSTATTTDTTVFGSKIKANPSTGNLTVSSVNNVGLRYNPQTQRIGIGLLTSSGSLNKTLSGVKDIDLATAATKDVDDSISAESSSVNLPTTSAVVSAISSAILAANVPAASTTAGTAIITAAASAGSSAAYARADHTHQITSATITLALGYTPTSTHYTSKNIVAATTAAIANASAANGSVYLNHLEESTVKSYHKISGDGATTVTADDNGNITIKSTNTTYSAMTASDATAGTAENSKVITAKVLHGERASGYGTTTIGATITAKAVATATVTISNVTYNNTDLVGYKLKKGTQIVVNFVNANTVTNAALTLNIAGTGAKPIFVDGATVSSGNQFLWDAGTEIEFIYDGTNYRVVSAPISDGDITNLLNS